MNDSELRQELASIRNLLTEVLVNQEILSKKISADVAIQATQAERAVELARLRRTADKATRRIATVD
jgi:D-alanyl-D-alanine carboxypeptidase